MLKRIVTLILVLILIPLTLSAQMEDKYLVAVDLDLDVKLSRLDKLNLSVYHIFEGTLIAGASEENIKSLHQSGISFRILDEYPESNRYFMVISKKTGEARPLIKNQVIFDAGQSLIIKDEQPDVKNLASRGLICVEMNKIPLILRDEKLISEYALAASLDSVISDVLVEIDVDSVRHYIQSLQDFGTRYLRADNRDSVATWIKHQFEKMGYTDVVLDEFWNGRTGTWQKNVIATIPGSRDPQSVYVIGGHHDSITGDDPMTIAPGADDNASGTTAVLEIARAIMASGYQPEATFKFMTFAAEEWGLYGSFDYAERAYNSGMNIKLMINHDMISHTYSSLESSTVDINYYTGWEDFSELAFNNSENYTVLNANYGSQNSGGSDSYSFWAYGFPAVYFEEHDFSPFYHSNQDVIENYSMEFCTEVIKASCATLISASVIPSKIEEFKIVDMGDGNTLLLSWAANSESDLSGYNIYFGTTSAVYDTVFTTTDTSLLVDNLSEERVYYIGITAYDDDTFESTIVEKTGVPRSIPLAPSSVSTEPLWHSVELRWTPNSEYDIAGYNIYRSKDLSEPLVQINESMITDTSYIDNTVQTGIYNYYVITALDEMENESLYSDTMRTRGVSLDQGILVVDETVDGTGAILRPTDEEVDNFYKLVLARFSRDDYDVVDEGGINLADLGIYSTIIWHGDDFSELSVPLEVKNDLKKYLEFGGNLLYTGFLPSRAFEGNIVYPVDYSSGDFLYDYLKIQHVESVFGSRFYGAVPSNNGYQAIYIDSSKTRSTTNYHLKDIEGIQAAPGGTTIYLYDTKFDTNTAAGSMNGQSVGVGYFGDDYNVVTLSFPLYFMQEEQAEELMHYVLAELFYEAVNIEKEDDIFPEKFSLMQNYPNPFNPKTVINYQLPITNYVDLSIYNMLGQKVAVLVSEKQSAGSYQVEWDATGFASGVYFYILQAGDFRDVKKMVLLR